MGKYNPFAKRMRKRFVSKKANPSVNFTELPRNTLDLDDELIESEQGEERKTLGMLSSPEIERSVRSYTRKSSAGRYQRQASENSPFGPRRSVGRLSLRDRIDYEGMSTTDLIKRLEKELQDTRALHLSTESEVIKLKERIDDLRAQSIEPGKPGTHKLEATLKQQLDKKVESLTGCEERMENLGDKLVLLDRAKELEELLRCQEEGWEKVRYAEVGNKELIKRYINEVTRSFKI
eukprot:TRINITY_DN9106_c0_g1_i3.p1 TRINITY_DN9106_c0_g1~~TRINITY_DN9106_c0_g1_i3.p1  ORF type:complete len:235 (-),score=63.54 TRINITY_DN9106_c0_g1_i3:284-988(-)